MTFRDWRISRHFSGELQQWRCFVLGSRHKSIKWISCNPLEKYAWWRSTWNRFFSSHKTASAHFYPTHASINLGMKKLKTWLKLWDFMKNWRNRLSWAVGQCQIDTFDFWHNLQVLVWIKADSSYQTSTMNLQILEIGEKVTCFKVIWSRWIFLEWIENINPLDKLNLATHHHRLQVSSEMNRFANKRFYEFSIHFQDFYDSSEIAINFMRNVSPFDLLF